jgi:hypothetical protein
MTVKQNPNRKGTPAHLFGVQQSTGAGGLQALNRRQPRQRIEPELGESGIGYSVLVTKERFRFQEERERGSESRSVANGKDCLSYVNIRELANRPRGPYRAFARRFPSVEREIGVFPQGAEVNRGKRLTLPLSNVDFADVGYDRHREIHRARHDLGGPLRPPARACVQRGRGWKQVR